MKNRTCWGKPGFFHAQRATLAEQSFHSAQLHPAPMFPSPHKNHCPSNPPNIGCAFGASLRSPSKPTTSGLRAGLRQDRYVRECPQCFRTRPSRPAQAFRPSVIGLYTAGDGRRFHFHTIAESFVTLFAPGIDPHLDHCFAARLGSIIN
jgi:hypothetical protein